MLQNPMGARSECWRPVMGVSSVAFLILALTCCSVRTLRWRKPIPSEQARLNTMRPSRATVEQPAHRVAIAGASRTMAARCGSARPAAPAASLAPGPGVRAPMFVQTATAAVIEKRPRREDRGRLHRGGNRGARRRFGDSSFLLSFRGRGQRGARNPRLGDTRGAWTWVPGSRYTRPGMTRVRTAAGCP